MTQNRSSAVMQQRSEPPHSLDDYPSPPWSVRALCEWLGGWRLAKATCREPAANRGHMVRVLEEYFNNVEAADIFNYGAGYPVEDYLFEPGLQPVNWTITNPPFRLAEQFIERALDTSSQGVAMIVRAAFLEGVGRHERLFSRSPPTDILQFTERVVMHKGKLSEKGSTATAYCWLVWLVEQTPRAAPRFHWIPPCRRRLERPGDYDEVST